MTHLPFIVGSYVIAVGVPVIYAVMTMRRLKLARRRLAVLDPRARDMIARDMAA
jgi:hypothetical protein